MTGLKRLETLACFMSFKYNYITASVRVRTLGEEVNIVLIYILLISYLFSSQAYSFLCRLTAKKEEEKQDPTT